MRIPIVHSTIMKEFPSNSDYSEYIPLQSIRDGVSVHFKDGSKTFIYSLSLPIPRNTLRVSNLSGAFDSALSRTMLFKQGEDSYVSTNGLLVHTKETPVFKCTPLMVATIRKKDLFTLENPEVDIPHSKIVLVVDKDITNHDRIWRGVKRDYLDIRGRDIDVLYTNDIINLCYNPGPVKLPKLQTLPEILEHTNSMNQIVTQELKISRV